MVNEKSLQGGGLVPVTVGEDHVPERVKGRNTWISESRSKHLQYQTRFVLVLECDTLEPKISSASV